MSEATVVAASRVTPRAPVIRDRARLFYAGAACVMLLVMVLGFRHFYLEGRAHPGRELTPPIRTLIIVHAVSMSAWVLLFLAQTVLITRRQYKTHMALGRAAAVFAGLIVVTGLMLSIQSTRFAPPGFVIWSLTGRQFMAVPFFSILLFGAMVGAAVWFRNRSEIHRPMMLFATLSALGAATGRIDLLNGLYQGTAFEPVLGPSLGVLVIGGVLLVAKWALTRSFDKWFAISYGLVVATFLLTMQVARTDAWGRFVDFVVG